MHLVKPFKNYENIMLKRLLVGQVIKDIEYSENIPLEDNTVNIYFTDGSYLKVYALMRIIKNKSILLCSSDYYFNKEFVEDTKIDRIEDTLISNSLLYANKELKNSTVSEICFNKFGDMTICIGEDIVIEIYFDTTENDKDYYSYFGKNDYFSLCKIDNQVTIIEDLNE